MIEQKKEAIRKELSEGPQLHIKIKLMMELCGSEAPTELPEILDLIADEVEKRGEIDYDRDPGETSDWLRAEAEAARKDQISALKEDMMKLCQKSRDLHKSTKAEIESIEKGVEQSNDAETEEQ